jgi:hypothetical protein
MNKNEVLKLNVVPDGQEPWLSYDDYQKLKRLFETMPLPSREGGGDNHQYLHLHRFLTEAAGLALPMDEASIHFNAFALIRRGYKVEPITKQEYEQLRQLMVGLEKPEAEDPDLHDAGGHRALYNYLTRRMGLSVQPGRGPVWYRANDLIKKYESDHLCPAPAAPK